MNTLPHPADPSVSTILADGAGPVALFPPAGSCVPVPSPPPASFAPRCLTDAEIAHRRAFGDWDSECRRVRGKSQKQLWIEEAERLLDESLTGELQPWGPAGLPPAWSEYTETRTGGRLRSVTTRRWRAWPHAPASRLWLTEWKATR
jgi:hypothetical protein